MKRNLFWFLILFSLQHRCFSQDLHLIDSLFSVLKFQKEDTTKVNTLNELANEFRNNNPDTAVYFGNEALHLATKLNYKMGIADAYFRLGTAKTDMGNYDEAMVIL